MRILYYAAQEMWVTSDRTRCVFLCTYKMLFPEINNEYSGTHSQAIDTHGTNHMECDLVGCAGHAYMHVIHGRTFCILSCLGEHRPPI